MALVPIRLAIYYSFYPCVMSQSGAFMIVSTMYPTEAALSEGKYIYMEDLLALEKGSRRCRGPIPQGSLLQTACYSWHSAVGLQSIGGSPRDSLKYAFNKVPVRM